MLPADLHNVRGSAWFGPARALDLGEVYRTAPYLHHGKAKTLRDVLTTANKGDKHGKTSHLKADEIDDLREVMSRRELYRRMSRMGDDIVEVAERIWYAVVKEA